MRVVFYKCHNPGLSGLFAALIRKVTKGPYSHCELTFSTGESYSSSIQDGGCRFKQIVFDPDKWDFVDIVADETKIRKFCIDEYGCKYDFPGVFRFLVPWISESPERWFCSEICCAALQEGGLLWSINAWQVSPSKLYDLLINGRSA